MGKKNRKAVGYEKIFKNEQMKEKSLTVKPAEDTEKSKELIKLVHQYKGEKKYEDALKVVIDLFNMGYVKTEILYQVVDIYYTISDYDRTVVWGKKTLSFDENHIPTMLILGNVYAVKNNINECLEMLDRILFASAGKLANDQKNSVEELLEYLDSDYDPETLRRKYPNIEKFLNGTNAVRIPEDFSEDENPDEDLPVREMEVADLTSGEGKGKEPIWLEEGNALAIGKIEDDTVSVESEEDDTASTENEQGDDEAVADLIVSIMAQRISLREKIDQCNSLAVGYFEQGKHGYAMRLLKQALEIDGKDERSLKNWAFMLLQYGEKDMALQCLMELRGDDLMVANLIKTLK